jgi:beta-glucanase (GH16 family)
MLYCVYENTTNVALFYHASLPQSVLWWSRLFLIVILRLITVITRLNSGCVKIKLLANFDEPVETLDIMNLKKLYPVLILLVLLSLAFSGCEESNSAPAPTNLSVEITNSNDGSGIVFMQARADDATEYEFYFGVDENEPATRSTSGVVRYTYADSGEYTIEVRALGDSDEYASVVHEVSIQKSTQPTGYVPAEGHYTPLSYNGWTLAWQDEFAGNSLNTSYWNYEIGTGDNGWGNWELQYYRPENTTVEGGFLLIEAKEEEFQGSPYTSSRLTTQNKYNFRYGRVDIRAALPKGQGLWPALWMLGSNFTDVGWPACGELDIMEMIGGGEGRDDVTHGTIHWDQNGYTRYGGSKQLDTGTFYDEFHVFSIIWDSESIIWLLDDVPYLEADLTPEPLSEFHGYFFFIMNVAVGGGWPGYPNETTQFPQRMIVDYIRVFQPAG